MDDLISRQAMIDAISTLDKFGADERNRIIRWNEGLEPYVQLRDVLNAIVNLPSAQSEPCEDAVSRLAVRHTLCKAVHKDARICDYVREIDRLPSAQPEREKGEWILVTDHFVCNRCGEWRYHQGQEFCGNCGADMRGK